MDHSLSVCALVWVSEMMWQSFSVLLLASACLCQQRQPVGETGDRQIRLEDIERDTLSANQKTAPPAASQTQPAQPSGPNPHQLAAYQQQLLLQQLQQQQYFAPNPFTYNGLGGVVPLMIIPSNHLGAGSPIQAYFVPTDPQFFPQYHPQVYQSTPGALRYQQPQRVQTVQRVPQEFAYVQQQVYRPQPQNYPSASVVYAGTPTASFPQTYQQQSLPQQSYQPQAGQQQQYNAYNALYQQQQDKSSFSAGVKSTPSPPVKSHSQAYSPQQSSSQAYSNFKTFNYNQ